MGTQISVQVSYTDGHGTAESLTSAQTAPVANVNDPPTGVPTIGGTAAEDQVLTADTSGIGDADGLGAFSYQWLRDGVVIGGATSSTYTLGDADVGTQVSVQVSYTDGQGTNESLTSAQTAPVANVNDAPVGVPGINGTPTEDQILTADTSGISDADGLGAFGYQWLRNGLAVGGATGNTLRAWRCGRWHADQRASLVHRWTRHGRVAHQCADGAGCQRQRRPHWRAHDQRHADRGSDAHREYGRHRRR